MYCNVCLTQIPFISSTQPSSTEMSPKGFAQYFVFRPAQRGTILFGGERDK